MSKPRPQEPETCHADGKTEGGEKKGDLGVQHDGAEGLGVEHGRPEIVKGLLVVVMGAMGEVEARYIHTSPQKLLDHFHRPTRWSQRAHYLCLGPFSSSSLHSRQQNHTTRETPLRFLYSPPPQIL